jgi:hypothetical protein
VAVRSVRLEDVDQLARLFNQFGHPQTADGLRLALEGVLADPRAEVLVADDNGALVGATTYFMVVPVAHDNRVPGAGSRRSYSTRRTVATASPDARGSGRKRPRGTRRARGSRPPTPVPRSRRDTSLTPTCSLPDAGPGRRGAQVDRGTPSASVAGNDETHRRRGSGGAGRRLQASDTSRRRSKV